MTTYIGVDNIQKGHLVLVCKLCESNGEIRTVWREKLRGEAAIRHFFQHFLGNGFPIYFATTWVNFDPGGFLEGRQQNWSKILRYHPWELKSVQRSGLPARFQRAEQLATQAIQDTHFSSTIRCLRQDFEFLDSQIGSLISLAGQMRRQLYALECQYPDPDPIEIPF